MTLELRNARRACFFLLALLLAQTVAAEIIIDGQLDADYGLPLADQIVQTHFGNNTLGQIDFANGSELNGAYAFIDDGVLYLFVAGNLESNNNRLNLFFDSGPGGQNRLRGDNAFISRMGDSGGPNGLTFDADFAANYWVGVNISGGSWQLFADFVELPTSSGGTGAYLGSHANPGGDGMLSGGTNPHGIRVSAHNGNTNGVTGCACPCGLSSASGGMTGIELRIPLAAIGGPVGGVKVAAFVSNSDYSFLSNQCLKALPAGTCNLGEPRGKSFTTFAGEQYFYIPPKQPPIAWLVRYAAPADDSAGFHSVAVDTAGFVYASGRGRASPGNTDFLTVKYDAGGNLLWDRFHNGAGGGSDLGVAVAVDSNGNVITAGTAFGPGLDRAMETVKYDPAGSLLWSQRYSPTTGPDNVYAMVVDATDAIIVGGSATLGALGEDFALVLYGPDGSERAISRFNNSGDDRALALALTEIGTVMATGNVATAGAGQNAYTRSIASDLSFVGWSQSYNGPGNGFDSGNAIIVDSAGIVYVAGESAVAGVGRDAVLLKYAAGGGAPLWGRHINGEGNADDRGVDLAFDSAGNIVLLCALFRTGTGWDIVTRKYDPNGNLLWSRSFDGPPSGSDDPRHIRIDAFDNIYICGTTSSTSTHEDALVLKYAADGTLEWVHRYGLGGQTAQFAAAMTLDANGNVYVAGSVGTSATTSDGMLVKYELCPGGCDDGDPCTIDFCDNGVCLNTPIGEGDPCDDGDPCTINDQCIGGVCTGEAPPSCDDGDPCTIDFFDCVLGACSVIPIPGCITCENAIFNPATGHWYLRLSPMTWEQAEAQAISLGGHLVTINDVQEDLWLVAQYAGYDRIWIGLNDRAIEGVHEWSSGQPFDFAIWAPGQPDNGLGLIDEDGVQLYVDDVVLSTMFHDAPLSDRVTAIVEFEGPDCDGDGVFDLCDPIAGPMIIDHPQPVTACPGDAATFHIAAHGAGTLMYAWRRDGTPLLNGMNISGVDTDTLVINPVTAVDLGKYDVIVSNSCGTITSGAVSLSAEICTSLALTTQDVCVGGGDLLVVEVSLRGAAAAIVGGQFFLSYDAAALDFLSAEPGDAAEADPENPFEVELFEAVNEAAGTIDYGVGIPFSGSVGATTDVPMARFTFAPSPGVSTCDAAALVSFRSHNPPTRLTDENDNEISVAQGNLTLADLASITVDAAPPMLSCPVGTSSNPAAGSCEIFYTWSAVSANDLCDGDLSAGVSYEIDLFDDGSIDATQASNSYSFPPGTHRVTAGATDFCGNAATCSFLFTNTGESVLMVDVELAPLVMTPLTRCITFELFACPESTPVTVKQEMTFIDGLAQNAQLNVPCGIYTCITARDALHTLRRADGDDFGILGASFIADFTSAGASDDDALIGGNLNDDDYIDILDFGIYVNRFGANYGTGDTTCTTTPFRADISGDGMVDSADFTFVQINFLRFADENCCGLLGTNDGPTKAISVTELRRRGLAHLATADLNADGMLDAQDVVAFINGARPRKQVPAEVLNHRPGQHNDAPETHHSGGASDD